MKDLWLSRKEVAQLTGWSRSSFFRQAKVLRSRPVPRSGRNGKRAREYAASSLPAEAQRRMLHESLSGRLALPGDSRGAQGKQAALFSPAPEISESLRQALTPEARKEADRRLAAIAPLLDFRRNTNGHRPVFLASDGRHIRSLRTLAAYLAAQHGVWDRTLWRWYSQFQAKGYAALADRIRSDKGSSRFFEEHPAARDFAENKYLGERLSVRLVHQAIEREWPRIGARGSQPPSYSTVYAYLRALPKPLAVLARQGEKQFNDRCAPYVIRGHADYRVNEFWCSDHMIHDLWVFNDGAFPGAEPGQALRPWLTGLLDMRSRKLVGAVWNATPSSETISSCLRQAILACGLPECLYVDNGRDYAKIGRVGISPEALGVCARLAIEPIFCLPFHPQAKPIESFFRTVHKRFDALWAGFYCGETPEARPDQCALNLKQHALWRQGKAENTPLPKASEFVKLAQDWIAEYNETHEHSGRGMAGKTPDEVFAELAPRDTQRLLGSVRQLDGLFWQREKRKVSEGGCVQLFNQRYEPSDQASTAALFLQIERDVLVACDPLNLGEAICMDLDGQFLGALRAQKLIAMGPISRDDVRASMRMRRRARRAVRDYISLVAQRNAQAGNLTELDVRRRKLGLPLAGEPVAAQPSRLLAAGGASSAPAAACPYIDEVVAEFLEDEEKGG